jgi:hypothetical protein
VTFSSFALIITNRINGMIEIKLDFKPNGFIPNNFSFDRCVSGIFC